MHACPYLVRKNYEEFCNKAKMRAILCTPGYWEYCRGEKWDECWLRCSVSDQMNQSGECPYRIEKNLDTYCKLEDELRYDDYYCKHDCKKCNRYIAKDGIDLIDDDCFITTACIQARNLPDDCKELQVLRNFRDTYLKLFDDGNKDVETYYEIAPKIVEKINSCENSRKIYEAIYNELVKPCVLLIEHKEYEQAHSLYKNYVIKLYKKFLDGNVL